MVFLQNPDHGYSFPIQNRGNAFQQSNSLFGPCTSPVTSSQSMGFLPIQNLGNLSGTFGTETAAPVSDSSVKPPFGSTSSGFGVGFNYVSPFAPSRASSGFGASPFGVSSVSVPEGPSIPAFKVPTTHEFGVTSTPLYWCSYGNQTSSGSQGTTSSVSVPEGPSIPASKVPMTHEFGFTSTPLYWCSYGNQTSSGSQGTTSTTHQGAMHSYQDKSHEELRSEDYGLHNKGYSFPIQNQGNAFQQSNSLFGPCTSPVTSSQSMGFFPIQNLGNLSGTFGTETAAPVSDSSVKPPFGRTSTNMFSFPKNSGVGNYGSPFAPSRASSDFGASPFGVSSVSVPEGPSIPAFKVPTTHESTPLYWCSFGNQTSSGKGDKVDENSSPFQLNENSTRSAHTATQHEDRSAKLNHHQDDVAAGTESRADHVLALLPKLPDGGYYTEPSLHKLAAKEMEEPGFCSHVNEFVVGRQGYGSIKFLGETDVRHLDIKSIVHFSNREVIVYPDGRNKPGVGQELHKAGEVTVLNVKCINKNTGQQYVEGHLVESYKDLLIKTTLEHGAEFVSFNPVAGEWKFRVPHF